MDCDALVAQVKQGDAAEKQLFESLLPVAKRIARRTVSKYPWVDLEDLQQQMLLVVPAIIRRYSPEKAADFPKYAYHRLYFEAKDCLREHDPLGVSWPQKSKDPYPSFSRLGDEAFDNWEPEDYREVEEDLEDLTEVEQQIHEILAIREFFSTLPPLPKKKKARNRKYKVREHATFQHFVRDMLGEPESENKQMVLPLK